MSRIPAIVMLAAALALGACHASSSQPPSASLVTPAAPDRGATLTAYADNDGPTSTVLLTGKIGDHGQGRSVNRDGSVNKDHTALLEVDLTQGSFRIDIADLDKKFVGTMANFPPNRSTCSGAASATGAAPIVEGSGTGAYKGITGSFALSISLVEVDVKPTCSGLTAQLILITGTADVRYT